MIMRAVRGMGPRSANAARSVQPTRQAASSWSAFDETGFDVEPMAPDAVCTPHSVSAHMLYENSDPFILHEPGGHLDVTCRPLYRH
jgi:hypothetical protein